jgi:hypothetical protein
MRPAHWLEKGAAAAHVQGINKIDPVCLRAAMA